MEETLGVKPSTATFDRPQRPGELPDRERSPTTPRVLGSFALVSGLMALLTASCCALPIALSLAGLSGAWLGQLAWLAPYREWLQAAALLVLAVAWALYLARRRTPRVAGCHPEGVCASGSLRRRGASLLVGASALTLLALLLSWYEGTVIGVLLDWS